MKKIKVNEQLFAKARRIFKEASEETIRVNEGLSRAELRALEKKGVIEKLPVFGKRKYSNVTPTKYYVYRWLEEGLKIHKMET